MARQQARTRSPSKIVSSQDDALVTALSVRTDQLLEPGDLTGVLLILQVNVKLTRPMLDYMGL